MRKRFIWLAVWFCAASFAATGSNVGTAVGEQSSKTGRHVKGGVLFRSIWLCGAPSPDIFLRIPEGDAFDMVPVPMVRDGRPETLVYSGPWPAEFIVIPKAGKAMISDRVSVSPKGQRNALLLFTCARQRGGFEVRAFWHSPDLTQSGDMILMNRTGRRLRGRIPGLWEEEIAPGASSRIERSVLAKLERETGGQDIADPGDPAKMPMAMPFDLLPIRLGYFEKREERWMPLEIDIPLKANENTRVVVLHGDLNGDHGRNIGVRVLRMPVERNDRRESE